jgi:hypothetical protein
VLQVDFAAGTTIPADTTAPTFVGTSPQLFLTAIDRTLVDKSAFLTYVKFQESDPWFTLPYTAFSGATVLAYSSTVGVDGQNRLYTTLARATNLAFAQTTRLAKVRIVVIPANVLTNGRTTLDWGDYEAVRRAFNLPE